jgi:hypothetical protein
VRARSIDQKELRGSSQHGLAVGGDTSAKSRRRSSNSGGRRWTRGKGGGSQRGSSLPVGAEKEHGELGGDGE